MVWILITAGLFGVAQVLHGRVWPLDAMFSRWDGGWYLSVLRYGYKGGQIYEQTNVAFFPLYPLIAKAVWHGFAIQKMVTAAVSVSVVCFGGALVLFYDLVRRRYSSSIARWATVLLGFNPFGLFFGLVYTESLYLLLSVGVFWLTERRWFWWAAAAAGVATASRPQGVILALMVVARWLWLKRLELSRAGWRTVRVALQALAMGLVGVSGLVVFGVYLQLHNHDALAFAHVQVYWGRIGMSNLWPALWGFAEGVRHHTIASSILFSDLIWYASIAAGLAGGLLLLRQREYWYAAYVALGVFVPLSSGSIEGMDRYVMVLFPIYIAVVVALHEGWERRLAVLASGLAFVAAWLIYLDPRQLFFG
jgi:hypothetical protein